MGILHRQDLFRLLSLEYNCTPEAFSWSKNRLTLPKLREGRRMYSSKPYFFHMVTLGGCAVITADACLHPFLRDFMAGREGHWLFELPNLLPLERELNRFGQTLTQTHHMFLPHSAGTPKETLAPRGDLTIRRLEGDAILPFYGDPRLPNAICPEPLPHRPDRVVICAYDGDRLLGMAGCSEDAPGWMQIGIDVIPEARSRGIGTHLVALLKEHITQSMGAIPFYGTSLSNEHSRNIALNCGFRPAWVEIGSTRMESSETEKRT